MTRSIQTDSILTGPNEVVLSITHDALTQWALEVVLLQRGLNDKLRVWSSEGSHLILAAATTAEVRARWSTGARGSLRVSLPANQIGYLEAVLLRAWRDSIAETNHIHLEGEREGRGFDLTVMFDMARPPMSGDEATRRLLEE